LMVGSIGERMLSVTLPHVRYWNAWFTWFGNSAEGYVPMRALVDEACRKVGRDPSTLERTVALYVAMPGAQGGPQGNPARPKAEAIPGDPETLAATLRAFAAEGISHVQLVLDPITADSIRALAPALALFDA